MKPELQAKLASYKPPESAIKLIKSTTILFLVGPSGAGKDSLKNKLLSTGKYHHIVSHTTRRPRINQGIPEIDGKDYHFINLDTAEQMLDNHKFIEAKYYSSNLYGTSLAEIEIARKEGKKAMTDIEVQGVAEYKSLDPNVIAIFLVPPDFTTWQTRLTSRYGDVVDMKDNKLRLETALTEIEQLLNTNYYTAVINDDLDKTLAKIQSIVDTKAKNVDDSKARQIAKELAQSIQAYLDKSEANA